MLISGATVLMDQAARTVPEHSALASSSHFESLRPYQPLSFRKRDV